MPSVRSTWQSSQTNITGNKVNWPKGSSLAMMSRKAPVIQEFNPAEDGMISENSIIETYTLPHVKQITDEAGHPKLVLCDNLEGSGGEGRGRRVQEGRGTCIPMANSYVLQKPS